MEVIQIDVGGKLAHFRKYYANNTAMTFSIPPRTTIMGMLAAILGRPRDSYYEEFASDKIRIGIRVLSPLKKSFHRLNLLSIKSKSDFDGSGGRIQTPFEIVSGLDISRDMVKYRLFVSCTDAGAKTFDELKLCLRENRQKFALTFGTANFTASILQHYNYGSILETPSEGWIDMASAIPSAFIEKLDFDNERERDTLEMIEEELLPADFVADFDRELSKMNRVLFSTTSRKIKVQLSQPHLTLRNEDEEQKILFLE
jgi:CRISPR-associated protein Cas5h